MTDILGTENNVAQILKNKQQKSMAKKLTFNTLTETDWK